MTNNLIVGYTHAGREPRRRSATLFPFVVIGDGDGSRLHRRSAPSRSRRTTCCATTRSSCRTASRSSRKNHSLTFGGTVEKYHSDNSFYFGIQSAYVYNTLADFYADANGYLANPNRTVSPVDAAQLPGASTCCSRARRRRRCSRSTSWYAGGYVQDEWRPQGEPDRHRRPARRRAEVRQHGLRQPGRRRADVPRSGRLAGASTTPASCRRRRRSGRRASASTGTSTGDQKTQVRGGTGVFTGKPPYVWISNQIGNTGVLYRLHRHATNTTAFPFNPNPDKYKPARDRRRRRPATSSTSPTRASGSRRPGAPTSASTAGCRGAWSAPLDYIYNRDLNAPVYINANLPAAQGAYTGVDNRPRWVATTPGTALLPGITVALPACVTTRPENGPCVDAAEQRARATRSPRTT